MFESRSTPLTLARRLRAPIVAQFIKFGVVGVSNTLITFAVYTLLVKVFGVWYLAASGIGFAVGAVNGYLLNRRWTFRGHAGGAVTAVRWVIVQGCGLLLNLGLVYLFVAEAGLDKLVGQAFATAVVVVITFYVNRRWTFRMPALTDEEVAASIAARSAGCADGASPPVWRSPPA